MSDRLIRSSGVLSLSSLSHVFRPFPVHTSPERASIQTVRAQIPSAGNVQSTPWLFTTSARSRAASVSSCISPSVAMPRCMNRSRVLRT